jgi:putative FmdB family regulatory protein
MPTYEYVCPAGHAFDKFQRITDKARVKCPTCGKLASRKISGGAGLVFKGSGFYITDYGKDGKGPRKPEAEKPADAAAKPEAKSDKGTAPAKAETPAKPAASARKKAE